MESKKYKIGFYVIVSVFIALVSAIGIVFMIGNYKSNNDYYMDCNKVLICTPDETVNLEITSVKKHGRNYEIITEEGTKIVASEDFVILCK